MRLIGAGQKRYFEIHTFGSNSPPHPGKSNSPSPGWPFRSNSRHPGQSKHSNARGLPGGMLMFRIDRRISEIPQIRRHSRLIFNYLYKSQTMLKYWIFLELCRWHKSRTTDKANPASQPIKYSRITAGFILYSRITHPISAEAHLISAKSQIGTPSRPFCTV